MGAPAISTAPRRAARAATKPRRAPKPRPAAKPKARAAARPAARSTSQTAAKSATRRKPTARAAAPQRARVASRPRGTVASAGNVVLFPVAAVSGIADSGLVTGLTRSRLWIGLLGVLLGGIVAINVWGLGLSASLSTVETKIDGLLSDNGVISARNAEQLSTDQIQAQASAMGLAIPAPAAIHYLDAHDSDAAKAAKRLAQGEITVGAPALQASETDIEVTDPTVTTATTDPAVAPVAPDPVATTTDPIIDPNTGLPAVDPATGVAITAVDPVTGAAITP